MELTSSALSGMLFVIIILLVLIMTAIIVTARTLLRAQQRPIQIDLTSHDFDKRMQEIVNGTTHLAEAMSVVKLVRELEQEPDAIELIKSYPETIRAAAWMQYINTLGASLQKAQSELAKMHDKYPIDSGLVVQAQASVDGIRAKLDDAVAASGQTGLRRVD